MLADDTWNSSEVLTEHMITSNLFRNSLSTIVANPRVVGEQLGGSFLLLETLNLGRVAVKLHASLSFMPRSSMICADLEIAGLTDHQWILLSAIVYLTTATVWG
jgi:hypothetical protein